MVKQPPGILRIGTSGVVIPGNKQSFPAAFQNKSRLNYYSSLFNTVEINSSFYKLPMPKTFEKWRLDTTTNFQFTVKLWKEITHVKQLEFRPTAIDQFMQAANGIADKKGCLLIQFPASITADYMEQVKKILLKLKEADPENTWRKAIEFRSESWYNSKTYKLLNRYEASVILHDMPNSKNTELMKAATFVYCRFHGPAGTYRGSYSNDYLQEQAVKMRGWLSEGKDVYAYFNNTIGNAFENAMHLREMINT